MTEPDTEPRRAKITSRISRKLNTGNYSTIECSKCLEVEVTWRTPQELKEKSESLDRLCVQLLNSELKTAVREGRDPRSGDPNGEKIDCTPATSRVSK